jgi:hypothetical protein
MAKKLFCVIFTLLLVSASIFAEYIANTEVEYLKYIENDEEFASSASSWEDSLIMGGYEILSCDSLSRDVYNAISRGVSRWNNLRVGHVFIVRCYLNNTQSVSYDIFLRITSVRNNGSFTYSWYAWKVYF